MKSATGDGHGGRDEQEQERLHRLDQLDELLRHFRAVEQLFRVMGKVDPDAVGGGELVLSCSEIGLNLAAPFRKELERVFGREDGGDTGTERLG
ncbi:hypothetical protein [Fundidesulfovibrio agrisoli]|uniref:hypothetical protein n=1 Tax=Fundidesulfovibrio agrisoli TaxID=2922717 RepID=UPI001FAD3C13|nr:hypothetical protein [Fundidesulfovibrio agrisoli]